MWGHCTVSYWISGLDIMISYHQFTNVFVYKHAKFIAIYLCQSLLFQQIILQFLS